MAGIRGLNVLCAVRDLLDSLYRGYPSGAILVWETDEHVPLQEFAVAQRGNPYQNSRLLLDGQQRLTSLSAVIRGEPVFVRGRKRPLEILFNLEHPDELVVTEVEEDARDDEGEADEDENAEEIDDANDANEDELQKRFDRKTFVVATKKLEQLPQWVRVSDVFKSDSNQVFLRRAGITDFDDPRVEKYGARLSKLRAVRKYVYRMDVLERTLSYDEVTEIFVRVNSLGAKLRSSDLALAQITAKWRGSLEIFQTFRKECAGRGFDVDLGIHLKNLVAFATDQSRFQRVGSLRVDQIKEAWEACREGMHFAMNFLRSNVGIESPALLSSPFVLVALAYYGHKRGYRIDAAEATALRYWAMVTNAKARYTRGSAETFLDQDLAVLRDGGGARELIDRLRMQVGRLEIQAEELEGRNQRSALFKTMFLAFRASGAKDWTSNLAIDLDHSGTEHKLQFHHVFPKALLKGKYTSREADDIANLAFIGGKTNRRISDKAPARYFEEVRLRSGNDAFEAQCIPYDPQLLDIQSYKEFLAQRRQKVAACLNAFIGSETGVQAG